MAVDPVKYYSLFYAKEKADAEITSLRDELELVRERAEEATIERASLRARIGRQDEALANLAENVAKLEETLAVAYDDLLSYKDYYGTSPAQVRHLQSCTRCLPVECMSTERCPDYPAE